MSAFKFACPHCDQHIQCESGYAGLEIACPVCTRHFIVPHPKGAAPAPVAAAAPGLATAALAPAPLRPSSIAAPPAIAPAPAIAPPPIAPRPTAPVGRSQMQRPAMKKARGNDGWATDETTVNKLGLYLVGVGTILAALANRGVFGIEVPGIILWVAVIICGVVGGMLNLIGGRGPIWAGILIGVTIALGAYGVMSLWIASRESVRGYECTIAFFLGSLPGMFLQKVLQKLTMGKP